MTDSYYRDLCALYELIKAASKKKRSKKRSKSVEEGLSNLKKLVDQAENDAAVLDSGANAVRSAHKDLDAASGWRSAEMETQLNGLHAAHVSHERPALEYVLMMLSVTDSVGVPFVNSLQKSLGKDRNAARTKAAKALASTATKTGKAADTFCTNLLQTKGHGDDTLLIYSALLALRSIIDSQLPEGTRNIIDNLILHLPQRKKENVGKVRTLSATSSSSSPGGCYWPKCYVYSCSCSKAPD